MVELFHLAGCDLSSSHSYSIEGDPLSEIDENDLVDDDVHTQAESLYTMTHCDAQILHAN